MYFFLDILDIQTNGRNMFTAPSNLCFFCKIVFVSCLDHSTPSLKRVQRHVLINASSEIAEPTSKLLPVGDDID